MSRFGIPTLPTYNPPPPPPTVSSADAATIRKLCGRMWLLRWSITVITKCSMLSLNIPTKVVQSYGAWSKELQILLNRPESQEPREALLRLAGHRWIRRLLVVVNLYVYAQFAIVRQHSEDKYAEYQGITQSLAASIGLLNRALTSMKAKAESLSNAPGRWWRYSVKVKYRVRQMQRALSRIKPQRMTPRLPRKEFLAALSLLFMRLVLLFAGAPYSIPRNERTESLQEKRKEKQQNIQIKSGRRWRLMQWILGRVDVLEVQPALRWIVLTQQASGIRFEYVRSEKALRDELDQKIVDTPAWLRIKQHKKRIDE